MRKKIFEIIELSEDNNLISNIYDRIMQVAIVVSIIPLMFRSHNAVFTTIESVVTILFVADYLVRWATADLRSGKSGIRAFVMYPFTLIAIIDLITILPAISYVNDSLRVLRTWRLLRILRIAKVFEYYEPLQIVMEVFRKKAPVLLMVVGFALFYIFVTALFMFNVEQSMNPGTGELFFDDFFDALYWSTCTLTTVGYGDIYPISDIGRVVSMISALVGIAIIALPSGIITAGYMEEVNERMDIRISNLLLTFVLCSISIISFTESMNNDTSNIIILLPSYHRIIHKVKPTFDREHLKFCFPNGFVEKVKIDKHLRQKMMLA